MAASTQQMTTFWGPSSASFVQLLLLLGKEKVLVQGELLSKARVLLVKNLVLTPSPSKTGGSQPWMHSRTTAELKKQY